MNTNPTAMHQHLVESLPGRVELNITAKREEIWNGMIIKRDIPACDKPFGYIVLAVYWLCIQLSIRGFTKYYYIFDEHHWH